MLKTIWEFLTGPTEGEPHQSTALVLRPRMWLGLAVLVGLGLLAWWLWSRAKAQKKLRRRVQRRRFLAA